MTISSCELERIDIEEARGASQRTVLVGLLLAYMEEVSNRSKDMLRRCRDVFQVGVLSVPEFQSMLRRVEHVDDVKDSLGEMMRCVGEMMDRTYQEVEWVLSIDKSEKEDMPLLSAEHLLSLFDVMHVDMQQAVPILPSKLTPSAPSRSERCNALLRRHTMTLSGTRFKQFKWGFVGSFI